MMLFAVTAILPDHSRHRVYVQAPSWATAQELLIEQLPDPPLWCAARPVARVPDAANSPWLGAPTTPAPAEQDAESPATPTPRRDWIDALPEPVDQPWSRSLKLTVWSALACMCMAAWAALAWVMTEVISRLPAA